MGNIYARLVEIFSGAFRHMAGQVLILGLDGAGKTTIVYQLKLGERIQTIPTIGFNVETVELPNVKFTMWDVGGQSKIRPLWQHYFQSADAIVFVVDSTDTERMAEAKEELAALASNPVLAHACFLILANKQDSPRALGPRAVADALSADMLSSGKNHQRMWLCKGITATNGEGLLESFHALAAMLERQRKVNVSAA